MVQGSTLCWSWNFRLIAFDSFYPSLSKLSWEPRRLLCTYDDEWDAWKQSWCVIWYEERSNNFDIKSIGRCNKFSSSCNIFRRSLTDAGESTRSSLTFSISEVLSLSVFLYVLGLFFYLFLPLAVSSCSSFFIYSCIYLRMSFFYVLHSSSLS